MVGKQKRKVIMECQKIIFKRRDFNNVIYEEYTSFVLYKMNGGKLIEFTVGAFDMCYFFLSFSINEFCLILAILFILVTL